MSSRSDSYVGILALAIVVVLMTPMTGQAQGDLAGKSREAWVTLQQELAGNIFEVDGPLSNSKEQPPSFSPQFDRHNFAIAIAVDRSGSFQHAHQINCAHDLIFNYILRDDYFMLVPGDRVRVFTFADDMSRAESTELPLVHDLYEQQMGQLRAAVPRYAAKKGWGTDIDGALRQGYQWLSHQYGWGWRHLIMLVFTDNVQDVIVTPSVPTPAKWGLPDGVVNGAYLFPASETGYQRDLLYARWYFFSDDNSGGQDRISVRDGKGGEWTSRSDFPVAIDRSVKYAIHGKVEGSAQNLKEALVTAGKGITARPDDEGEFVLHPIQPGEFIVRVQHPKLFCSPRQQVVNLGQAGIVRLPEPFVLTERPPFGIAGQVRFDDADGSPAAGMKVTVSDATSGQQVVASDETDDSGAFAVELKGTGEYRIQASYPSSGPDQVASEVRNVKLTEALPWAEGIRLSVPQFGLAGRIETQGVRPPPESMPEVRVARATEEGAEMVGRGQLNDNAQFRVHVPGPGTYWAWAFDRNLDRAYEKWAQGPFELTAESPWQTEIVLPVGLHGGCGGWWVLWIILLVIAVVLTLLSLRLSHTVQMGLQFVRVPVLGDGAPIVVGGGEGDSGQEGAALVRPTLAEKNALKGRVLGHIAPGQDLLPSWLALPFLRTKLYIKPAEGVKATVNGKPGEPLVTGTDNSVQMVAVDADNAAVKFQLQPEDFVDENKALIAAALATWGLDLIALIGLLICSAS